MCEQPGPINGLRSHSVVPLTSRFNRSTPAPVPDEEDAPDSMEHVAMAAAVSEKLAFDPFWSCQQEGEGGGGGEKDSAAAQPTPQSTRSYVPITPLNRKHAPLDGNIAVNFCSPDRRRIAEIEVCSRLDLAVFRPNMQAKQVRMPVIQRGTQGFRVINSFELPSSSILHAQYPHTKHKHICMHACTNRHSQTQHNFIHR